MPSMTTPSLTPSPAESAAPSVTPSAQAQSSASLVTPSAKSHERVTGRWVRDIKADDKNEWTIFYAKIVFGTPVPWLIAALSACLLLTRAGAEIAAWSVAGLSLLYILADLFSRTREFRFFAVGGDLLLISLFASGTLGALWIGGFERFAEALGGLRWIPLIYLLAYAWELFPGLNRAFAIMTVFAVATAVLSIVQTFSGVSISGAALSIVPVTGRAYHAAVGFFDSPEAAGTAMAVFLPLPAMAFLLGERKELSRWLGLALTVLLALGALVTYRPGVWIAAVTGLIVALLMRGRRQWVLALAVAGSLVIASFALYPSSDQMFDGVAREQAARAETQRAQINQQLKIWSESPWVGAGFQSVEAASLDSTVGNVYFQILAQAGALGLAFYLIFSLAFLLGTYRILQEIPRTHYWHRVLVSGGIAGLVAFHAAGLFWFTLSEALAANLFCFMAASLSYVHEHYSRGFVPDDHSL